MFPTTCPPLLPRPRGRPGSSTSPHRGGRLDGTPWAKVPCSRGIPPPLAVRVPLPTGQATSPKPNVPRQTSTSLFPRTRRGPGSSNTSDQDGRLAPVPRGEAPVLEGERHVHWAQSSVRSTRKHPLPFCFPPVLRPAYPQDRAHHFSLEHVHARGLAPLPTWAVAWLGRHEVTAPCSRRAQPSLAVKLPAQHSEAPFAPSAGNLSQAQRASRNQHVTFASTTRTPGVQPLCPRGRGASAWPHLLWSTSARSLSANRPHSTSSSIFPRPPRLPWRSTTQGQDSRLALVPMGGDPVLEGSATSTVRLRRCTELGRRPLPPYCPPVHRPA